MRDYAWPYCYLRWDQPLQSCWMRQASVYISLAVALFCIAQVEAVCCEDILLMEKHTRCWCTMEMRIQAKMSSCIFTSHMCPTIGASAQECSAFIPIFPFGYEISVKDLSNHLQREENVGIFSFMRQSQAQRVSLDLLPTCRNISHGAEIWRSRPGSRPLWGHNPVAHHLVSGRRRPTRRHPGTLCSHLG